MKLRVETARRARLAPLAILTLIFALLPTVAASASPAPTGGGHHPPGHRPITLTLLGFNDFHGAIDPPTGSSGAVNGVPAGGSEYLASTVKRLRAAAGRSADRVVTVAAGDNIGASPLVSAAFHDEPTIEELNSLGLDVTSVGNHEFDEGVSELLRLQRGGCHPTDGCADGDPYHGAKFPFLAANTVYKSNGKPILPPYKIVNVRGVKVAFVGETLKGTAGIVNPAGIGQVQFLDEATTANYWARKLRREQGVQAFVLLLHQGGQQNPAGTLDPNACENFTGEVAPIVSKLDPGYGIVVSGHTHRYYSCTLPNSRGSSLVTSAGTNGVLVTDITATINPRTKGFTSATASNVLVENSIRNADGTYTRDPSKVDPAAKRIADKYRTAVAPIANRVVGSITADITNTANAAGESALGDVIADAQLAYTAESAGAQIALMNPGGIRASLLAATSSGGEAAGQVTYGEAFTVQPFNNLTVTQTFTGDELKAVLEQQWAGCNGQTTDKILQVSAGLTYTYSAGAACGSRVSGLALNGTPIVGTTTYRVTTNDFLANGGDGFSTLTAGDDRVTAPGFDIDALTAYLGSNSPVAPGPQNRITRTA